MFVEFWGCAKGPARSLTPVIRIISGVIFFLFCLFVPIKGHLSELLYLIVPAIWVSVCAVPLKILLRIFIWSGMIFIPLLIFTPWIISARGIICILISTSTASILTFSDVQHGLSRLPIPKVVTALLVQILHQAATLTDESRRISAVLRLRNVSKGYKLKIRVITMLPVVWMVRIINRAERVGAAMELRGFDMHAISKRKDI